MILYLLQGYHVTQDGGQGQTSSDFVLASALFIIFAGNSLKKSTNTELICKSILAWKKVAENLSMHFQLIA